MGWLGQFVDLRGAWQERGGGVFEGEWGGVDTPMHIMVICQLTIFSFELVIIDWTITPSKYLIRNYKCLFSVSRKSNNNYFPK